MSTHIEEHNRFLFLERVFVILALFFFLGAVLPLLENPNDSAGIAVQTDPVVLFIQLAIYLFGLMFLFTVRRGVARALLTNPLLSLILVLAVASTAWSPVPDLTLRRALSLIIVTMFALYLGIRYTPPEILRLFAYVLLLAVLLNVIFVFLIPSYGVESQANHGAWRGAFLQKNIFARYMVIAAVTFIYLKPKSFKELGMKVSGLVLAPILVIGSISVGSYVMAAFAMLLIPSLKAFRLPIKRLLPVGISLSILTTGVLILVRMNAHMLLSLLGRSATLTGRVPLWHILLKRLSYEPVLGYGVNGFWSTQGTDVWTSLNLPHMMAAHAHNGYLDLSLELGALGLGVFLVNSVLVLWRCMVLIATERTREAEWPFLLIVLILGFNCFESDLLHQNGILWIAYVALAVSTQRAIRHRLHQPSTLKLHMSTAVESVACVQ